MMTIPLTAHAQSGGEKVVQAAADDLKPAFCENSISNAIKIVEDCYAKVDADPENSNMNQCVMEDSVVVTVIFTKQKQYLRNYMTSPYANLPFMQRENLVARVHKHPNFMSNVTLSQDAKDASKAAGIKVLMLLDKEGCFNPDKLK